MRRHERDHDPCRTTRRRPPHRPTRRRDWRAAYAGILTTPFLVGPVRATRREIGWATVIEREPRDVRVAVDSDGEIVGFGSCGRNRDSAEHRRRGLHAVRRARLAEPGIGRALLLALFERLVAQGCASAIIWVLRDNPGRFFYRRLGGREVRHKHFVVGGKRIEAAGYAWPDLPRYLETARADGRPAFSEP